MKRGVDFLGGGLIGGLRDRPWAKMYIIILLLLCCKLGFTQVRSVPEKSGVIKALIIRYTVDGNHLYYYSFIIGDSIYGGDLVHDQSGCIFDPSVLSDSLRSIFIKKRRINYDGEFHCHVKYIKPTWQHFSIEDSIAQNCMFAFVDFYADYYLIPCTLKPHYPEILESMQNNAVQFYPVKFRLFCDYYPPKPSKIETDLIQKINNSKEVFNLIKSYRYIYRKAFLKYPCCCF